jgi:hypothetical protein
LASPARGRAIGLPERALVIRSSWTNDACPRRAWFELVEGLRPKTQGGALRYGTAWHAVLEEIHTWWRDRDGAPFFVAYLDACPWCLAGGPPGGRACTACGGTRAGVVARVEAEWAALPVRPGKRDSRDAVTLRRAAEGWLLRRGAVPPSGWRVLGVEVPLCYPIRSPESQRGAIYAPELPVVTRPDGSWRYARTGEATPGVLREGYRLTWERHPAYCAVRSDCLWAGPNGELLVDEWKSSADPQEYVRGLLVDPQVTAYEAAVRHLVDQGLHNLPGPGRVAWPHPDKAPRPAGWRYDVVSSHKQRDLEPLKGRGKPIPGAAPSFSVAAANLSSVTSWRLRASLAIHGVDHGTPAGEIDGRPVTWGDRIAEAVARIDPKFYATEGGASPPDLVADVRVEQYAAARRRAAWYRAAASASTPRDVREAFPRVPICRHAGGSCPYLGPCAGDGEYARRWYDVEDGDPTAGPPVSIPDDYDGEPDDA